MSFANEIEVVLYKTENGAVSIDTIVKDENMWLSQNGMAELFGIDRTGIGRHLSNIFKSGELIEEDVCEIITLSTQHDAMSEKNTIRVLSFTT